MSPSPPFSWSAALEALRRPGRPPAALPATAAILLVLSLAAVVVLIQLGHAWHDDPHRYFGERKVGTYLSFVNLVATGVVAALVACRLAGSPFARFWRAAAAGFVWLACDDLFVLHERIDRGVHALLGLDPDDPVTDHLDDLIVAGYGAAAVALAYAHRAPLAALRWMLVILTLAFAVFATMVVVDFFHLSKTVEDALKVVAGTLILVGFLAAWLEVSTPGGAP
jgi:hypothetical protein